VTREWSYFYLCCPCRSQHTCRSWMETGPSGGPEARRRCFLALMVGTPGSTTLSPHRGSMFITLMVGAPGSPSAPPRGLTVDDCYVDGGRSRISASTSHGARRRRFLALIVDAPESPALSPLKGGTMSSTFPSKSFFRVLALLRTWK
jgi:hypothetical protein